MEESIKEQIGVAVAIQGLTSSVEFMKGQLTELSSTMKNFATKAETDEVKKGFNKIVEGIKKDLVDHNLEDKMSFGNINSQIESLKRVIYLGLGGLGVITFFVPIVIHYIWK